MISRATAFRLIGLALAVLFVLAGVELLATAYLFARDRRYVPARERLTNNRNTFIDLVTDTRSDCRYIDTLFPHPYVGFVHHRNPPCGIPSINNVGLFGPDFPTERPADRFVVLLTGSSVASQFLWPASDGRPYIESMLNRDYQSPTGRPFLFLNGGDGAWKQPQQTILFLLYADAVHAVVTLDGFNERHMLGGDKRFEYPANNFGTVNPLANAEYSLVVKQWILGKIFGFASQNAVLSRSQAVYLLLSRIDESLRHSREQMQNRSTTVENMFALPQGWSDERVVEWALGQYEKYIRAMDAVAAQNDVLAAHFIQPVPAIDKPLTDDERRHAGPLTYAPLYQRMADRLLSMRGRYGTNMFSMLDVFHGHTESLYADDGHLRRTAAGDSDGYRMMAVRMEQVLAKLWQLKARAH